MPAARASSPSRQGRPRQHPRPDNWERRKRQASSPMLSVTAQPSLGSTSLTCRGSCGIRPRPPGERRVAGQRPTVRPAAACETDRCGARRGKKKSACASRSPPLTCVDRPSLPISPRESREELLRRHDTKAPVRLPRQLLRPQRPRHVVARRAGKRERRVQVPDQRLVAGARVERDDNDVVVPTHEMAGALVENWEAPGRRGGQEDHGRARRPACDELSR